MAVDDLLDDWLAGVFFLARLGGLVLRTWYSPIVEVLIAKQRTFAGGGSNLTSDFEI